MVTRKKRIKKYKAPPLSDRERILLHIVDGFSSTQLRSNRVDLADSWTSDYYTDPSGYTRVHFAFWDKPKPGDLVLAQTGSLSAWKVGFFHEALPSNYGGAVIREIGTGVLCDYSNESFVPIRGLWPDYLWDGDRYKFKVKVLKACRNIDGYQHIYQKINFEGNTAIVTIRERFGGMRDSVPYEITLKWNKRTSIKSVEEQMTAQGYGTREFGTKVIDNPVALV